MHDKSVLTLLHKQLTDQLESTDRQLLIDWLANSSRNIEEQQEVSKIWELSGNYNPPFEPDVDKSFEKFSRRLQEDVPTGKPAKVMPLNPIKSWMKYAAAAVVLIGAIAVWQLSSSMNVNHMMVSTITDEVQSIELADGTKVWVNEKSSFTYPDKFTKNQRVVELDGHAYFEVANAKGKPFIIRGQEADVRVLGTSFALDTDNDGILELEVKEGTVEIIPEGSGDIRSVTKNEKMYYDFENKEYLEKELLSVSNADFFLTDTYRFVNSKYTFVFSVLENVYDVEFEFGSEGIENCKFTSPIEFDRSDIASAFEIIEAANKNRNLKITKSGDAQYVITADSCE